MLDFFCNFFFGGAFILYSIIFLSISIFILVLHFYQKALIVLYCSCIVLHVLHFTKKKALLGTNAVN